MPKKKAYVVYPRTKEISLAGLQTKGGKKKFRGGSFLNVSENGAAELRETYSKSDLHIVEDDQLGRALNGEKWEVEGDKVKTLHNYHFGPTARYSKAWEEFKSGVRVKKTHEWVFDEEGNAELVRIPTFEEVREKRKKRRAKLAEAAMEQT